MPPLCGCLRSEGSLKSGGWRCGDARATPSAAAHRVQGAWRSRSNEGGIFWGREASAGVWDEAGWELSVWDERPGSGWGTQGLGVTVRQCTRECASYGTNARGAGGKGREVSCPPLRTSGTRRARRGFRFGQRRVILKRLRAHTL